MRTKEAKLRPGDYREALRRLLIERGFISSREGRPLLDRRGLPIPWLYYGGEVNLSWPGLDLAASVLLERLATFSATQTATYGVSAIPLVAACVARAGGRYSGLVIRKEPKTYGAGRKIDGPIDRARPVVVIDESISSGTAVYEAICALEAEGLTVEGVVCIVEFSGYGAVEWLRGRGYRVETVFDIWGDLERPGVAPPPPPDPTLVQWTEDRAPSGLSPAQLGRLVLQTLSRTGRAPRPPATMDARYDSRGGVFLSVRRRADDHRLVRAGFRRDALHAVDAPLDVVLAAHKAFREAPPGALEDLEGLKISASLLGALEPICAGQIDHQRHALVVRGLGPLDRIGFALPNAPHYDDEIEQYRYARTIAASFWEREPHALYRQRVQRVVEPGANWPEFGAPRAPGDWSEDPAFTRALGRRLRQILREALRESGADEAARLPQPDEPIYGVGVSIYLDGLAGCAMSWSADLETALARRRCEPSRTSGTARSSRASRPADSWSSSPCFFGPGPSVG
jgi:AMMECR1 domain-containing protein